VISREAVVEFLQTVRDYARRVWDNSGDDNIFFLAGGIAFNLLLAAVPFFLLVVSGLAYVLRQAPDVSLAEVQYLIDGLLPPHPESGDAPIHRILADVLRTRGAVGLYSAIGVIWFSTRLFGSLRSVLADVFDIETERSIIRGKIFDVQMTVLTSLLLIAYLALSAYLAIARSRGVAVLAELGIRRDVMGWVEYSVGRLLAFAFVAGMFAALYKFLPNRRMRWQTALIGALVSAIFFEVARNLFTTFVARVNPGSLYSGTLYALVIIVFWVYYAALMFILGGEVAQVAELRRVRRSQREIFE
jgi:membrane protein